MFAVDIPSKNLLLHHDNPLAIRGMISRSRLLNHSKYNLAIHHSIDAVKLLRNIGIPAPAPIRYHYNWPGKFTPGAHQIVMAEFLTVNRRGFNLSEMGTAKTAASLWAADWLMVNGYVRKALVIAPLSTLERVWLTEIFAVLMHRNAGILHGSRERRLEVLKADLDFYIVNHDGLSIEILRKTLQQREDIDLVIVDEASAYCTAGTDRYKALTKLLRPDQRLWLMTGTPCSNAPTDAWSLAKLVFPSKVPTYFGTFRRQTMQQVSQFKWVPKPEAMQIVYDALQPAVRFRKAECLDLPPVTTEDRTCQLTTDQKKALEAMRKEMQVELKSKQITAVNAADKINKLRQILCIAYDTPVLTRRGWVPIQAVRLSDHVWDGVAWRWHDGVISKGSQQVVTLDGVQMTPGHEVLTVRGWRTAKEILDGDASNRFDRASVRLPDGAAPRPAQLVETRALAVPMCLRQAGGASEPEPTREAAAERQALRVQAQAGQCTPPNVLHPAIQNMDAYEASLHGSRLQGLAQLRWARDYGLRALAGVVRQLLVRHERRIFRPAYAGTEGQQPGILFRQLPMGDTKATSTQHTKQCLDDHTAGAHDCSRCSRHICDLAFCSVRTPQVGLVGHGCADNSSTRAATYDIVNCGPLRRFVVRGIRGEHLIVHNCGAIKDPLTTEYVTLDHKPRLNVLMECIEQAAAKVFVIVPFKGIIQALAKEVSKVYTVGILNGDVSIGQRNEIIKNFKTTDTPHVLLCHPQVMAHGLNLTEADMCIFYAPIYSNDQAQQVVERFNRAGQTRSMTVVRIGGHKLEWDIYKLIEFRRLGQQQILDLYLSVAGDK